MIGAACVGGRSDCAACSPVLPDSHAASDARMTTQASAARDGLRGVMSSPLQGVTEEPTRGHPTQSGRHYPPIPLAMKVGSVPTEVLTNRGP